MLLKGVARREVRRYSGGALGAAAPDEIVQEVFVKIWQRAGDFDASRASPITWMVTIARNRALDEVRKVFAAKYGFEDREPVLPPLALADMIAGLYGAFAVMTALRHRDQGGGGQVIDLPLLDPMFSILGPEAAIYKLTGAIRPRTGSRSNTAAPRNVYRTRDGRWISMSASMQAMVERLYAALDVPGMLEDPRFKTNAARVANADAAEKPVRDFIAAHTLEEGMAFFERNEITAAPVYDIVQFIEDPHVRAREILVDMPDTQMGTIPMHAVVPRLSGSPGAIRRPAPELGEHTGEVLLRVGVDEAARADLQRRKVI